MAIDYIIDYPCVPKRAFTTDGIIERLKGEDRAAAIIALFRENGDDRPPSEMGFEFSRSAPNGEEQVRVIVVQDLLDAAAELHTADGHCEGCPANRTGKPFGCMGFVQYPVSEQGELWLLNQLPMTTEPLVWLLLKQGLSEFDYDGASVRPLRAADGGVYFRTPLAPLRQLGEVRIDADQLFEMLFAVGHINPNHAALLLLFLGGIDRDLEADDIMHITPVPPDADTRHPFTIRAADDDDTTTLEIKGFVQALYLAWRLNVRLLVDS
ncbi:MAG: hypothetical protein H7Y11_11775 [Armatimonadetes bacterium]|nr:hypothetical protein [Anaerolineae bacterium]